MRPILLKSIAAPPSAYKFRELRNKPTDTRMCRTNVLRHVMFGLTFAYFGPGSSIGDACSEQGPPRPNYFEALSERKIYHAETELPPHWSTIRRSSDSCAICAVVVFYCHWPVDSSYRQHPRSGNGSFGRRRFWS